jgi:Kef-type K+ transport system membrane component KefB
MIRAALVLAFIVALTVAARSFLPQGGHAIGASGAALGFGFILLAAIQAGYFVHAAGLPHLTGFILCGAIVGPQILGFVDAGSIDELEPMKRVAVGLIGLLAGCELNIRALRQRLQTIGWFAGGGMLGSAIVVFVGFFAVTFLLPVTRELPLQAKLVIALIGANALMAFSPPVVIGIINETRARGPVTELCTPIVVVADLAIVLSFSVTNTIAHQTFPVEGAASGLFGVGWHIFGSIGAGLLYGIVLALYITRVKERIALFVFGTLFVIAESANALHLDTLLVALTAGLFLENVSPVSGHEVLHETEPAATPTFVLFFAIIGAQLQIRAFLSVAIFSLGLALVRAVGVFAGARFGARCANADAKLTQYVPFCMLPQAGIALALASTIRTTFKPWGDAVGTILLGVVVVNQVIPPILFRTALARAGEIPAEDEPPPTSSDPPAPEPVAEVTTIVVEPGA